MTDSQEILQFWFGDENELQAISDKQSALWWGKNDQTDATIKEKYSGLVEAASAGNLEHWKSEAESCLAYVLLLDQFSRNIYRGTAAAFANDARALSTTLDGLKSGLDKKLSPMQRVFFYLPLEHSESLAMQELSLHQFKNLQHDDNAEHPEIFSKFYQFAEAHYRIIKKFDRYPHRNAMLGRQSSAEELAFLQQPNSSF